MSQAVGAVVDASEDRRTAAQGLQGEPFSFSEVQAHHVLDTPLARRTRTGRRQLQEEAEEVRHLLGGQ
jgi:DNA gyrase/topoisomerase IV subunit A